VILGPVASLRRRTERCEPSEVHRRHPLRRREPRNEEAMSHDARSPWCPEQSVPIHRPRCWRNRPLPTKYWPLPTRCWPASTPPSWPRAPVPVPVPAAVAAAAPVRGWRPRRRHPACAGRPGPRPGPVSGGSAPAGGYRGRPPSTAARSPAGGSWPWSGTLFPHLPERRDRLSHPAGMAPRRRS
jgi:hypothetical protein